MHRIGRTGRDGRSGVAYTLVAPADGKHLDAILKLIQKPIDYLETGGKAAQAAAPAEDGAERPARPTRSRRGGPRTRAEAATATETAAPAPKARPAKAAPVETEETASEAAAKPERGAQRPSRGRGRQRPEAEEVDSDAGAGNSPFGNDGPIPAFLLRPTRAAS